MWSKKSFLANVMVCLPLALSVVSAAEAAEATKKSIPDIAVGGLPLQHLIGRIWSQSPAVEAAKAAVASMLARQKGASRARYNPELTVDAERTDINTFTVGLSQTIDWGDQRQSLTAAADADLLAAMAALAGMRKQVATEALAALARYQTALDMQQLARSRTVLMKRFMDTVEHRYRAGDMHALDVSLARLAYSESLLKRVGIETELAESIAAMQAVSDLQKSSWPTLPMAAIPVPEGQASIPAALAKLPALQVLQMRLQAAQARVRLAKGAASADPTVAIRLGREDSSALFGLSLELPLFVRNRFRDDIAANRHEVVRAEEEYREASRRARARITASQGRFENMLRAWRFWQVTGRQAQQEQQNLLAQLWQAGELTASDYLIQAKQSIDTQATATQLGGDLWQAAIAWLDASGRMAQWLGLSMQTMNSGEIDK